MPPRANRVRVSRINTGPVGSRTRYRGCMKRAVDATPKVTKSDQEWRQQLSREEYAVLREAATERPWTGEYVDTKTAGIYECRACGAELFRSTTKFESHCGWPSFFDVQTPDTVIIREDRSLGMVRKEV